MELLNSVETQYYSLTLDNDDNFLSVSKKKMVRSFSRIISVMVKMLALPHFRCF